MTIIMKKLYLSLIALLSLIMTACTEDYSVANELTVNPQESILAESDVTVQPLGPTSIDIVQYLNEDGSDKEPILVGKYNVAEGKLPINTVCEPHVYMSLAPLSKDSEAEIYEVPDIVVGEGNNIYVSPSVLSKLYSDNITRKPDVVNLYLATKVTVITDETTKATVGANGGKYYPLNTISYKPDAVVLEDAYYYLGQAAMDQTYKFTNESGGSFYDDPVISVIVPATGGWHWFRLGGASEYNADGTINWDLENAKQTSICPVNQNEEATEGKCINGTQSWHLIESDAYIEYRITVNLLEMTFKIEGISAIPEYYPVGTLTGWNGGEKVSAMFPTSGNTVTMTTYFTGAWDMRMWPAENFGDWTKGKAIGISENGGNAPSGNLVWNTENDGNLASPEAGYYTLDCDYKTMTYQWTKYGDQAPATYEKIGLVGANDDWSNDIFLTQVTNTTGDTKPTHLWYALGVKVDYCSWGVQFRADGAWNKQWGKGDQGYPYGQSNTTSNIEGIVPGTYNIYFNDITGHYFFIAQ